MPPLILIVLALCVTSSGSVWAAYAAFDDLQISTPTWIQVGGVGSPLVIYRISRHSNEQALVELRSTGGTMDLRWCLPGYQRDPTTLTTRLPTGEIVPVLVPLRRVDQGMFRQRLGYANGPGEPQVPVRGPIPDVAYSVCVAGVTAAFRNESLGYTISLRDGMADLHVRNFSAEPIHCDIALASWQDPATVCNPRLHLLPGSTTEVLIPVPNGDASLAQAVLDVWNICVGPDDRGERLISTPQFADHLVPSDGWLNTGVIGVADGSPRFNPRVITWQQVGDRLRLRNASSSAITAVAQVLLGDQRQQVPLTLPPGVITEIAAPFNIPVGRRPFIGLDQLVVDGQPVGKSTYVMTAAAVPEQALSVTPQRVDPRFNPFTLAYVLSRAGEGMARLTLINRSAITVHADVAIAGYQSADIANPRLHLPAGQQVTVELPVTRSDARLALARLMVGNVRLGEDLGDLLVSAK